MTQPIRAIDNFLPAAEHAAVWDYLCGSGWSFGAFSAEGGQRYFYKHFAGLREAGNEFDDPSLIEQQLEAYPVISDVWRRLKAGPLAHQVLGRCYANGMPPGIEGGVHLDSNVPTHLTTIYYPHPSWDADLGGETLFYSPARDEIVAAVFPKPNRLVLFPGTIPHVARPLSTRATNMRITLMFKTMGSAG